MKIGYLTSVPILSGSSPMPVWYLSGIYTRDRYQTGMGEGMDEWELGVGHLMEKESSILPQINLSPYEKW